MIVRVREWGVSLLKVYECILNVTGVQQRGALPIKTWEKKEGNQLMFRLFGWLLIFKSSFDLR